VKILTNRLGVRQVQGMALPEWHPPAKLSFDSLFPGSGEATPEEIFVAVGSALYHWEKMEVALAHLFHALIEARSGAAFRAYGSIQGIEGRRRAIEAAASSFFRFRSDPLLAQVFALTNAYASAASYRNNIAHGVTALFAVTMEDGEKGNSSWYLTPPSYATRR
jgi:hypothetical protein